MSRGHILIVMFLVLVASSNIAPFAHASEETRFVPHDPIVIIGDSGFSRENGVTGGSGSVDDPYIIENWIINASLGIRIIRFGSFLISGPGILIANTTAYFVIRNVNVHSGLQVGEDVRRDGIFLFHVAHATIEESIITKNNFGIATLFVEDSTIRNNLFRGNGGGMHLELSNRITVNKNMIIDGDVGIELVNGSHDNVFSNNRIERQSEEGVIVSDETTIHNVFVNNILRDTGWYGFEVGGVGFSVFRNNQVSGNLYAGFGMGAAHGNELVGNRILSNKVGIQLILSPRSSAPYPNTISANLIVHNDIAILSCKSQANILERNVIQANNQTFVEYNTC